MTFYGDYQRGHNFSMTMIRLSGSQLHAARVLVGLSLDDLAERAKLCRHSIRKWETSSHAIPGAMYTGTSVARLACSRARAALQRRWGLPAARLLHPNDSEGVHVANGPGCSGSVTPAYPTRGMSRSPNLRGFYNGSPLGCQVTSTSTASQDADR